MSRGVPTAVGRFGFSYAHIFAIRTKARTQEEKRGYKNKIV